MKFIGLVLRYISLISLTNCVMSVQNLSLPDADAVVAGDGVVTERASVVNSRLLQNGPPSLSRKLVPKTVMRYGRPAGNRSVRGFSLCSMSP